ncbi:hypothetical protein MIND_01054500 [Mycena indigotica]|uniref:HNH nuclease domain-containing protein n=1 Tax=Mycena indigotica TaxID=2126181 RepID=A0A8H6VYQ5_9AGAR|nr:uncharacterized protein MIND_01054500 [Mycena indigotica]KAF7295158.1 hypothetical protein MIND_01054500 [Mycena indigotica]
MGSRNKKPWPQAAKVEPQTPEPSKRTTRATAKSAVDQNISQSMEPPNNKKRRRASQKRSTKNLTNEETPQVTESNEEVEQRQPSSKVQGKRRAEDPDDIEQRPGKKAKKTDGKAKRATEANDAKTLGSPRELSTKAVKIISNAGTGLCSVCLVKSLNGQPAHITPASERMFQELWVKAHDWAIAEEISQVSEANGIFLCARCHWAWDNSRFIFALPLRMLKAIATEWLLRPKNERLYLTDWIKKEYPQYDNLYHLIQLHPDFVLRVRRPTDVPADPALQLPGRDTFHVFSAVLKHKRYRVTAGEGGDPSNVVSLQDRLHPYRMWQLPDHAGVANLFVMALHRAGDVRMKYNSHSIGGAVLSYLFQIRDVLEAERLSPYGRSELLRRIKLPDYVGSLSLPADEDQDDVTDAESPVETLGKKAKMVPRPVSEEDREPEKKDKDGRDPGSRGESPSHSGGRPGPSADGDDDEDESANDSDEFANSSDESESTTVLRSHPWLFKDCKPETLAEEARLLRALGFNISV